MTSTETMSRQVARTRSATTFVLAALVSATCLAAGGLLTRLGMGEWYSELAKPSWQPPAWAFSVAWTVIFTLKTFAVWLVARRGVDSPRVKLAVTLYAAQLIFNLAWSTVFFVLASPTGALVEIFALDALVIATAVAFFRVERRAALLLVPYVVWLGFATAINTWIVAHL